MEACPAVLFDALVLPNGIGTALAKNGHLVEYVKEQYRHCKPIMALGDARPVLDAAGIPAELPSGRPDPACLRAPADGVERAMASFIKALAGHRAYDRETDPPLV
jgi:catalase